MMKREVSGTYPTDSEVILASCDELYFWHHAEPFIYSIQRNMPHSSCGIHLHVINPSEQTLNKLKVMTYDVPQLTWTYETWLDGEPVDLRTYYACSRFFIVNDLMNYSSTNKYWVLDIDCIIKDTMDFTGEKPGVYVRDYEQSADMKVAAGALFLPLSSKQFVGHLVNELQRLPFRWFVDQIALNETKNKFDVDEINNDDRLLDWDFKPGTKIWTGKGDRKTDNVDYVREKNQYYHYQGSIARYWCDGYE